MSLFRTITASQPLDQPELPLVHTTRCEYLGQIIVAKALEPQTCSRFSEKLIYFFYGRPAYRSTKGSKPSEPIDLCPVCFVFKSSAVAGTSVRRVFPCDTGAIKEKVFEPEIQWGDLSELELDPTVESARKLVGLCFQSNANYFFGKLKPRVTPDTGSVFERLCLLINKAPTERADDRRSAIEVQVSGNVNLSGQLLFVALPREFFEDVKIRDVIETQWQCEAIRYPTFIGDAPSAYYAVVRDRVTQWLETNRFL